jgi:RAD51-like protein 2
MDLPRPYDQNEWFQDSYALTSLPLAPSTRSKLQRAGFTSVRDLNRITSGSAVILAKEAQLTIEEANEVLKTTRCGGNGKALRGARSAADILEEEKERVDVITFCEALDEALGGGVSSGEITEFCGCPGIGKTQIAVQLSVSVQIPREFGGVDGEAVYIDTEGSFMAERASDVAAACARHLGVISRDSSGIISPDDQKKMVKVLETFTVEKILRGIHLFRCHEVTELLAVLETLGEFIEAHPRVRLVVIDSVAFHFRQDFQDMALRTTILSKMTNRLMSIATSRQVAVVTVNQVTVKPQKQGPARLVPALGESYAHACTTRVILSWEGDDRVAFITKSPRLAQVKAKYIVTPDGIRDARGIKRVESDR